MAASSRRSAPGVRESAWRSTSSSRSRSSRWACIETNSPAAMEKAPATRPARPASRTTLAAGGAPATPRISETFVTSPSLMPNTAARAPPDWMSRWWGSPWAFRRAMDTTTSVATAGAGRGLAQWARAGTPMDEPEPAADVAGRRHVLVPERRARPHLLDRPGGSEHLLPPDPRARRRCVRDRKRPEVGVLGGRRPLLPQPLRRARHHRRGRWLLRHLEPAVRRGAGGAAAPSRKPPLPAHLVPLTGSGDWGRPHAVSNVHL